MRNDAMLNTGLSSALSRKLDQKAKLEHRQKDMVRSQLTPGAEIILEWIKEEKADVTNLEKMILNVSEEKLLQAQLLARQMQLDYLNKLTNRIQATLRTAKKKDKEAQNG